MSRPPDDNPTPATPRRRRFGCLAWGGILVLFGLLVGSLPLGPQHAAIRAALQAVLTQQTQHEVHVGKVEGVLWGGVSVEEIMIADQGGFGPDRKNVLASLDGIRLRYSLFYILFHPKDALGGIKGIDIASPQLLVRRDADGKWELAELFKQPPKPKKPKRPFTFRGKLTVGRGKLVLYDAKPPEPGAPVRQDIDHRLTTVSFDGHGHGKFSVQADARGMIGGLTVKGRVQVDPLKVETDLDLRAAKLPVLGRYLNPVLSPSLQLKAGEADVTGPLTFAPDAKPSMTMNLSLVGRGAGVKLGLLARPVHNLNGGVRVFLGEQYAPAKGIPSGVVFTGAEATLVGNQIAVDGSIVAFEQPRFDLHLVSHNFRPGNLKRALPKLAALQQLRGQGSSELELHVRNGLDDLNLSGELRPARIGWGDVGGVQGGRLGLNLQRVPQGQGLVGLTGELRLQNLAVQAKQLPQPIRALSGRVQLLDGGVALQHVSGRLGGGTFKVNGRLFEVLKPTRRVQLTAAVQGLSPMAVARAIPKKFRPTAARGTLSAQVKLTGPLTQLAVQGQAAVPFIATPLVTHLGGQYRFDLKLGKQLSGRVQLQQVGLRVKQLSVPIQQANGTLVLSPRAVQIQGFSARVGGDPLRLRGRLNYDLSSLDLAVATPGLSVGPLLRAAKQRDLSGAGKLQADLRLRGSLRRLRVDGTATLPARVTFGDTVVRGGRLNAALTIRPKLGAAGLTGRLTVADLGARLVRLPKPVRIASGRFQFDGAKATIEALDARFGADHLKLRGVADGLPDVSFVDLVLQSDSLGADTLAAGQAFSAGLERFALASPASVDLRLRGPLDGLTVTGTADLGQVTLTGDSPLTIAGSTRLNLHLAPKPEEITGTVELHDLRAEAAASPLPLAEVNGLVRLAGGRVSFEGLGGGEFGGLLGHSAVVVAGGLAFAPELDFDLTIGLEELSLDDLRTAMAKLEQPPEVEGSGALAIAGLRVRGPMSHLRLTTLASPGEDAGVVRLPSHLKVVLPGENGASEYEIDGGQAGLDLVLAAGKLSSGSLFLADSTLLIGATGTRIQVTRAAAALLDGKLQSADLAAAVGGGAVTMAATGEPETGVLTAQVTTSEVPLYELLPKLESLDQTLDFRAPPKLASSLTVYGPPEDLAIAGRVALGDGLAQSVKADVSLRMVKPEDGATQMLGGIRLAGGELRVRQLATPLTDLGGGLSFGPDDFSLEGLSARIAGQRVRVDGAIYGGADQVFDVRLGVDGVDLGAVLADLRLPDPADPEAPLSDPFRRQGLPHLRTTQPLLGSVHLLGPRSQLVVEVDLDVPEVALEPAYAMPDDRGLATLQPGSDGPLLLGGLRVTGTVVGALPAAAVPTPEEIAAGLERLAGVVLANAVEAAPADAASDEPSALDQFVLGLHVEADRIDVRQLLAFLPEEQRTNEVLSTLYAYRPGQVALDVLGPATDPEVLGRVELDRLELQHVAVRKVGLQFDYFGQTLTFTDGLVDIRGGLVTARGALSVRPKEPLDLVAQIDLDGLELGVLNLAQPETIGELNVGGVLEGGLTLHLSEETPRVQGQVNVRNISAGGTRVGDGEVAFGFEGDLLVLEKFDLSDAESDTHARVRGRIGLTSNGLLDLVGDIRNFDLGRLAPLLAKPPETAEQLGADAAALAGLGTAGGAPLETPPAAAPTGAPVTGRLDFVGAIGGTRRFPLFTGAANVFFGSVAGYPFNRLSIHGRQTGPNAQSLTLDLSDVAYMAELQGQLENIDYETGEADYAVDLSVEGIDLAQALPLVTGSQQLAASGTIRGGGTLRGGLRYTDGPDGRKLNALSGLTGNLALAAGEPGEPGRLELGGLALDTAAVSVDIAADQLDIKRLEVVAGDTRIGVDPAATNQITDLDGDRQVRMRLVSDKVQYQDLVSLTGLPIQTGGYLAGVVDISGTLSDYYAVVSLSSHGFAVGDETIADRSIQLRVAKDVVLIEDEQQFELFGTRLTVGGGKQGDWIQLHTGLEVIDFERLRGFLSSLTGTVEGRTPRPWQTALGSALAKVPQPLQGRFSADLDLRGPSSRPTGHLAASLRGVESPGERPRRVPGVEVAIHLGAPRPAVPEHFAPGVIYLFGSADVRRGAQADLSSLRLQARCDGLSLADYSGWAAEGTELLGDLTLRAVATGSTEDPRVELTNLAIDNVGTTRFALARFGVDGLVWSQQGVDLGQVTLTDGSLAAGLQGFLPLGGGSGTGPLGFLRPNVPLNVKLQAEVGDLSQFAGVMGSVDQLVGQGHLDLSLTGTARALLADGSLAVDIPRLQVVKGRGGTHHAAQVTSAVAESAGTAGGVTTLYDISDVGVRCKLDRNRLVVEQCRASILPGDAPAEQPRGEVEILPGGSVELLHLGGDELLADPLDNPVELQLAVRDVSLRGSDIRAERINLAAAVEPVFRDGVLNRLTISRGEAWLNGGLVTLDGTVGMRSPRPGLWTEHDYDLRLRTPVVDPSTVDPPAGARGELRAGGLLYPLRLRVARVGETTLTADVGLQTRAGQVPPLALSGGIQLADSVIREGAMALFARKSDDSGQVALWPAAPALDVTIDVTQNNWIRMGVPALTVPFSALLRLSETPQRLNVDGSVKLGEGDLTSSVLAAPIHVAGGQAAVTLRRNPSNGTFEPFASFQTSATTVIKQAVGGGEYRRYDVDLEVRGTAFPGKDKPVDTEVVVKAESNPALPEQEIFANLSRRKDFSNALEQGNLQTFLKQELTNAALQTAWAYTVAPLVDEFRQAIGLDVLTLRIELDRPLELQVGKYLLRKLFVTMLVEVGGPTGTKQTFKVDYELPGGFKVGAQIDTDQEFRTTAEYSTRF